MILDIISNCSAPIYSILRVIKNIIDLVQIIGPILCIINLLIVFTQLVNNPDEKKYLKKIKNSIMALVFLFFVPLLVNVSMNMLDDSFDIAKCYNNANKYYQSGDSTYQDIYSDKKKNKVTVDSNSFENGDKKEEGSTSSSNSNDSSSSNNSSSNNSSSSNSNTSNNTSSVVSNNSSSCSGGYCSVAHMGYSRKYKGNSLDAFEGAGKAGFWGCETDLRMYNGKLVCSHDSASNSSPSFSDYLDICKKYGMVAVIDIKSGGGEEKIRKTVEMVNSKGMINQTVFQCSMVSYLKLVRKYSSNARIWYLRDSYSSDVVRTAKELNAEAVNINYTNTTSSVISDLHNNNIKVCVYVVNSKTGKDKFLSYKADYIMSNLPL